MQEKLIKFLKAKCHFVGDAQDNLLRVDNISTDSRSSTENSLLILRDNLYDDRKIRGRIDEECIRNILSEEKTKYAVLFISRQMQDRLSLANAIVYEACVEEIIGDILNIFYPKNELKFFAVTGTNGKTSVANFTFQLLDKLGKKAAFLGTTGIELSQSIKTIEPEIKNLRSGEMTSVDLVNFHQICHLLAEAGCEYICFEASSHALDQNRIAGIKVDCAAFTNLTQDHLDYHENMENYLEAKLKLFTDFTKEDAWTIINKDDKYAAEFIKNSKKIIGYDSKDSIFLEMSKVNPIDFHAYNLTCAVLAVINGFKFSKEKVLEAAKNISFVPGRMQQATNSPLIFIDYAHTPDALEKILISANKIKSGDSKIIIVFGCGGDRDKTKRPLMAGIAAKFSNIAIVTDDNPRTENANEIRKEIISGFPSDFKNYQEIGDRAEAISFAIKNANPNDIILIAGKGHEDYQIIGTEKHHFSDLEEVKKAL